MSNKNVVIDLKSKRDRDGQVFYVGRLEAPVFIDCSKGAVFLVFTSDKGEEQLQIALKDSKEDKENKSQREYNSEED